MNRKIRIKRVLVIEIVALIVLVGAMIGLPVAIFSSAPWRSDYQDYRVVQLTAVSKDGVWTEEKVTNLNYWNRQFKPANLFFQPGEKILFRLTSMDVTHSFYVPELNIGPVEVKGGTWHEIPFIADTTGAFIYYCTTICGECHFYMQGKIIVQEQGDSTFLQTPGDDEPQRITQLCDHTIHTILPGSFIEKGQSLYNANGCITCHGESGKGGIINPNYVNNFVPRLDDLAEKMRLLWYEDAEVVVGLLEQKADLTKILDDPPFRQFNRFHAQYESIISKITDGAHELQKADSTGPVPPLYMPAWGNQMSNDEMNAIVAFLIEQQEWEN